MLSLPHVVVVASHNNTLLMPHTSKMGISRLVKYSATSLERGAAPDKITRALSKPNPSRTFLKTSALARANPNGFEDLLRVTDK
jgi:hypothetical protein